MLASGQIIWWLVVWLALTLAPTVFFLALWHGLHYVRDERLIEQFAGDLNEPIHPPQFELSVWFTTDESPSTSTSADDNACAYCGRRCSDVICDPCRERY